MFLSIVIPLTALDAPVQPVPFLGRAVHAWFLDSVARADPALGRELHASAGLKPFTVSGLLATGGPSARILPAVVPGQVYAVRWASLEAELSTLLLERVLPGLPAQVELGPVRFRVEPPLIEPGSHPLVAQTTAEEMVDRWFAPEADLPRTLRLRFDSPTAVRRIHRNLVVPEPGAVFRSLLAAWNRYGAPAFAQDLLDLVDAQVMINRYHLRTESVQIGEGQIAGCVGWCGYFVFQRERAARRPLHLLAEWAQFCGVGYKTTQGLGQVRCLAPSKQRPSSPVGG